MSKNVLFEDRRNG